MAALIKSLAVAGPSLLLGPDVPVPVIETVAAAKVISDPAVLASIAAAPSISESISDSVPLKQVDAVEDQDAAYRRFMAEHETRLKTLEENTRKTAYESAYAEGEKAGYAAGLDQGAKQGAEAYSTAIGVLEEVARAGREAVTSGVVNAEALIGEIVFQVVCKIVGDTLNTPQGVQAVVGEVLTEVKRHEVVALKLAPANLKLLLEHEATLQPQFARLQSLGLEADERVALGGCIVQLKGGHIDARIETQFRAFAQSLKEAVQDKS